MSVLERYIRADKARISFRQINRSIFSRWQRFLLLSRVVLTVPGRFVAGSTNVLDRMTELSSVLVDRESNDG